MAERRWTSGQQHCIDARGGTVLVSAAAGSGKTAVLIERIVSLLIDVDNPIDIDRLLVVTFTKAAAAEMRSRLSGRLNDLLSRDPHNRHLLRQQMLLPQATICTIDSFCAQLLREHATTAGVSPRFRVAEDTMLRVMKNDVAEQVIQTMYAEGDPSFRGLCDLLSGDRGDSPVAVQLLRTYDFIQAHPFPLHWLSEQETRFSEDIPFKDTIWGQLLLAQIRSALSAARSALHKALEEIACDDRMQTAYGESMAVSLRGIDDAITAVDNSWDAVVEAVSRVDFPRVKPLRGYEDTDFKAHIAALRDHAKKILEDKVKPLACHSEARAKSDIAAAAPHVQALSELVRRFSQAFSDAKAEQNMLDFNDMEHLVLSMLAVPDGRGGFVRTDIAKEIGARYSHIMVDEYQDTNATQDTLFSALSDEERNLFFVGDIKQSIYGFRQAMPSIFRERRENGTPYNGKDFPASITLGNNFRSRRQVTDTVNFFFRQWMQEETGGIVYDEREELVASAAFQNEDDPAYDTELLITEKKELDGDISAHEAEARLVGKRISELMASGFRVSDKNGLRQAAYRDFCVLLRSTARTADIYVKVLQDMGIPVSAGNHENFFDRAEIRTMLSVLRTIDNPLLDIPLLSTLMSPLFGFSPDDVAQVRAVRKDCPLYANLRRIARGQHPLKMRCEAFLATLERYRTLSAALPADQLIRRIYDDTDIEVVMSAKSGGTGRLANLRRLYDMARHFEQNDMRGLSAFVRYADKLESNGIAVSGADKTDTPNAVHVMTIHRSKGLEFPVVFVAGLGSAFNNISTKEDILLHADHGIGTVLRDRTAMTQTNPLHRQAIAAAITHSEHAEELRVLYVAMTRPKDKLILLASVENLQTTLERLRIAAGDNAQPTAWSILNASRMGDWVLTALLRHPAGQALCEAASDGHAISCRAENLLVRVTANNDLAEQETVINEQQNTMSLGDAAERLTYTYPFAEMRHIPAKITASQTAHRADGTETVYLDRPAFLSRTGLTPAQRGTAMHLFLEFAEPAGTLSAEEQADRMVERDQLTDAQKAALDLPRLQTFLRSPLAARMARSPLLLREFDFTIERTVEELGFDIAHLPAESANETVMVQGIADAVFEEDGGLVIVDYKTDRVSSGEELAKRYRSQLAVYKNALSQTLQRPVKQCVIYSFHLNDTVDVL